MTPGAACGPVRFLAACFLAALIFAGPLPAFARGDFAGEVVLGAPTSLATLEGSESLMAVRMAVGEINKRGGVELPGGPHRIRLVPLDLDDANPKAPPARAVARLKDFILREKPHAVVIGPFRSEVLLESMDLLARHRLPTLASIAMSPAVDAMVLKNPKYKYVFRVSLNTRYLVNYLIQAMKLLENRCALRRVFILNQDVAWARSTASLMIRLYLERSRWHITGQKSVAAGEKDFKPALGQALRTGSQVILAIFDTPESAGLINQWSALDPRPTLCGFISPASGPSAWGEFQGRLDGILNVIFELGNLPSKRYPPATAFNRAFRSRFGGPIQSGHGASSSYDAVHILAKAVAGAGSLDPDAIVAQLERADHQGAQGRVHFHRGHQAVFGQDPAKDSVACLVQWQAPGKRVIVYPAPIAEGGVRLP